MCSSFPIVTIETSSICVAKNVARLALTDLAIKRLTPPERGQATYFDAGTPGFAIRVSQGGTKTFIAVVGKKRQYKTIGKYPTISLKTARDEAKRLLLAHSSNPLERPAVSHSDASDSFLTDCRTRLKPRTVADYDRLLSRYFGFSGPLGAVTGAEVLKRLNSIDAPSERHHAFVAVRTYFNWCVKNGHLDRSPVANLAPTTDTKPRDRILSNAELKAVYTHASVVDDTFSKLVRILILTGLRRSEAALLHRDWIEGDELIIPGRHTKNGRPHTLPLTSTVQELLDPLPDQFFSTRTGKPFTNWGNAKKSFDEGIDIKPWRIHDLRRTFSSIHAQIGTPLHVTEKLLNHVSGRFGGVVGVYNRYDYLPERREALALYEEHIKTVTA